MLASVIILITHVNYFTEYRSRSSGSQLLFLLLLINCWRNLQFQALPSTHHYIPASDACCVDGGNTPIISLSLVSPDSQPFPGSQGLQTQSTPQSDSQPFSMWSEPALLVSSLTFMPFLPCGSVKPSLTHSLLRGPGSSLHVGNRLTAD